MSFGEEIPDVDQFNEFNPKERFKQPRTSDVGHSHLYRDRDQTPILIKTLNNQSAQKGSQLLNYQS